jgi:hypothetical protein
MSGVSGLVMAAFGNTYCIGSSYASADSPRASSPELRRGIRGVASHRFRDSGMTMLS